MNDKPLRERVSGMAPPPPVESAMPPRVPAPIRVDEEALKRALAPVVQAMERMARAAEEAAKILAETSTVVLRSKHRS